MIDRNACPFRRCRNEIVTVNQQLDEIEVRIHKVEYGFRILINQFQMKMIFIMAGRVTGILVNR